MASPPSPFLQQFKIYIHQFGMINSYLVKLLKNMKKIIKILKNILNDDFIMLIFLSKQGIRAEIGIEMYERLCSANNILRLLK